MTVNQSRVYTGPGCSSLLGLLQENGLSALSLSSGLVDVKKLSCQVRSNGRRLLFHATSKWIEVRHISRRPRGTAKPIENQWSWTNLVSFISTHLSRTLALFHSSLSFLILVEQRNVRFLRAHQLAYSSPSPLAGLNNLSAPDSRKVYQTSRAWSPQRPVCCWAYSLKLLRNACPATRTSSPLKWQDSSSSSWKSSVNSGTKTFMWLESLMASDLRR